MNLSQSHSSLLRKRLALMIAAMPFLYSQQVSADTSYGGGIFVGYSFDDGKVDWGFESYAVEHHSCDGCGQETVFGPVARLAFRGLQPYVTLTGMIGTDLSRERSSPSVGFEGGIALQFSGGLSVDAMSGIYAEIRGLTAYARQNWKQAYFPVGVELRLPTTDSLFRTQISEGRPFRDASGLAQRASSPCEAGSPAFGRHWQDRALEECASIPAFLQLAEELLDLGAPNSLVQRALDAVEDEQRHTRMATGLARQFGATLTSPKPPSYQRRPALPRKQQLTRLAKESWLDGCLGESAAAKIAGAEASETQFQSIARIQRAIESDEMGHAALAWDVLRWTLCQDASVAKVIRGERLQELGMSSMILSQDDTKTVLRASHQRGRDLLSALV